MTLSGIDRVTGTRLRDVVSASREQEGHDADEAAVTTRQQNPQRLKPMHVGSVAVACREWP
jgi:hypothetical protein